MGQSVKNKIIKYPLNIKKLPPSVKEAWFYGGRNRSIHIVLNPISKVMKLNDESFITHHIKIPQINIEF